MNKNRMSHFVISLIAALLLSACATTAPPSTEDTVKERAVARWDALLARDYAGAWEYYSPGYRSSMTPVDFEIEMRLRRVRWVSAEYVDSNCGEDSCTARFRLGYKVSKPAPGVSTFSGWDMIEEQWVRTGGEWWYLPEE